MPKTQKQTLTNEQKLQEEGGIISTISPTKRNKMTVLRELTALEKKRQASADKGVSPFGGGIDIDLTRKITQLRHELKMFDVKKADPKETAAIEELWQRQAEEQRIKQEREEKAEKERVKKAKREILSDKTALKALGNELTEAELQAMLDAKKAQNKAKKPRKTSK